jgi:hypothetical protein
MGKKERIFALRPHRLKHIWADWSHYTDTSDHSICPITINWAVEECLGYKYLTQSNRTYVFMCCHCPKSRLNERFFFHISVHVAIFFYICVRVERKILFCHTVFATKIDCEIFLEYVFALEKNIVIM